MAQKALVIGASGMLTEVSRWLARQGYQDSKWEKRPAY